MVTQDMWPNFAGFRHPWSIVDKYGQILKSGEVYKIEADKAATTFSANITFHGEYQWCDLVFYKRELEGESEKFTQVEKQQHSNVTETNGTYSLQLSIHQ